VYLGSGVSRVAVPGVLAARRAGAEVELAWLDRAPPSRPRLIGVPRARPRSTTVVVWRAASDAASGVARYRVRVDGRLVATTESTVATLPPLRRGRRLLTVAAVDRAGNAGRPARASVVVR
jgi:hypothetical protein